MEQLGEFISNNLLLVGGFVAVLLILAWTEFSRRGSGFQIISTAAAVDFINRKNALVVDVSPSADFNKGHIIDARNVPMSRIKDGDAELAKILDKPLLVTCKAGQTAQGAAAALKKLGATEVAVMKGGMAQWKADNYPVTRK